jgi:hypothetical protein
MKTRKEIVENWLPRYTGVPLDKFGGYILLTNFNNYVKLFAQWNRVPVVGKDKPMPSATADDITIINFGMGSATAATVMDLLSAISPKAVLFLGKCGGVKHRASLGDLILPIRRHPRRRHEQRLLSREKFPRCPPSRCRRPSPPRFAITRATTGPARCTPRTGASGSMMRTSKSTSRKSAPCASTWKPRPSS